MIKIISLTHIPPFFVALVAVMYCIRPLLALGLDKLGQLLIKVSGEMCV